MKSLEIPLRWAPENDNLNTRQTLGYTKDKYNVKIIKRKVSLQVSPTIYVGQRLEERKE
jgi:hypothetical protein